MITTPLRSYQFCCQATSSTIANFQFKYFKISSFQFSDSNNNAIDQLIHENTTKIHLTIRNIFGKYS